jgi:allophanate hydrolase
METKDLVKLAVCGAHMSGLPLNPQLLGLGAELVSKTKSAPHYKLFKLRGFEPPRPGMLRVLSEGVSIELEVWQLPIENYGRFVKLIPSPLGIGTLELIDGSYVQGFICEYYATLNADDISELGSWRTYIDNTSKLN